MKYVIEMNGKEGKFEIGGRSTPFETFDSAFLFALGMAVNDLRGEVATGYNKVDLSIAGNTITVKYGNGNFEERKIVNIESDDE